MTAGCVPLAALAAAFLAGSLAAATVEAVLVRCTGAGVWRWSPAPRGLRRIAFAFCGVGLAVTWPSAVHADTAHPPPRFCPPLCVPGLDGLRLPDLPASDPRPEAPAHRPVRADPPASVLVRPGDCLWLLALDLIGPDAPEADVARTAHALYRANRAAIGPDPDLIFPGTRLTTPEVVR